MNVQVLVAVAVIYKMALLAIKISVKMKDGDYQTYRPDDMQSSDLYCTL